VTPPPRGDGHPAARPLRVSRFGVSACQRTGVAPRPTPSGLRRGSASSHRLVHWSPTRLVPNRLDKLEVTSDVDSREDRPLQALVLPRSVSRACGGGATDAAIPSAPVLTPCLGGRDKTRRGRQHAGGQVTTASATSMARSVCADSISLTNDRRSCGPGTLLREFAALAGFVRRFPCGMCAG
jgi:hypothetical protein